MVNIGVVMGGEGETIYKVKNWILEWIVPNDCLSRRLCM